jgi:DNA segregation ATPase FtsK/SpoIIIE and related proteins
MKALPHAFSFISSCLATAILASPMPYIVQNKAELAQALEQYAINREGLELNSRSYNNPLLMGVTGVFALVSFGFMVKELSDKPLIEVKAPPQVQNIAPPVIINNSNHVRNVAVTRSQQESKPHRTVNDSDLMDETGAWILSMMFGDDGLKRQHYKIEGVSQSGKTTFVEYLLSLLSGEDPTTEKLLIDPKYRKAKPNWSFLPYCADITKVPKALEDFVSEVEERQQSETDFADQFPKIFVIDEWDWIYTDHGKEALRNLRKLIKVGAELRCYVVLLGQSPLAKDTGLSTSDFDQMVRISIGKVALKVLNNPAHFAFSNRDELLVKAEKLYTTGQRFALVQEHGQNPRLEIIPKIVKPNQAEDLDEENEPVDNVIPLRRAS